MNDKGQTTTHHWGWMIVVLIIFGTVTYIWSINRPDNYANGAVHSESHRQDWPLSIHIGEGSCTHRPLGTLDQITKSPVKK